MQPLTVDSPLVPEAFLDTERNALLVRVEGEIDLHNSPKLRNTLLPLVEEHEPQKLILNMSGVPYMDSSAIAVMVELLQQQRPRKGKLYLTNLHDRVRGLLEIARLETIFELVDTEDTALADA